jgi:hypothetical protein
MQPSKFTPIIISSVIMVTISLFPLLNLVNLICCSGIILGGFAGTAFYSKQLAGAGKIIQFKDGAAIGILSGIISALLVVVLSTLLSMILKENPIPELFKIVDSQKMNIPPEIEKFLQRISDEYSKSGFSFTLMLISLGIDIVTYPLFGALGGLLAVSILSRRKQQNDYAG